MKAVLAQKSGSRFRAVLALGSCGAGPRIVCMMSARASIGVSRGELLNEGDR